MGGREPASPQYVTNCSTDAVVQRAIEALDSDGAVIITHALSGCECDDIVREMRPFIDATPFGKNEFAGSQTRRAGALAARSPASHKALAHPAVLGCCQAVLGEQRLAGHRVQLAYDSAGVAVSQTKADRAASRPRYPWQLHLTQIIDIGPDETPQSIHRDRWAFLHDFQGPAYAYAYAYACRHLRSHACMHMSDHMSINCRHRLSSQIAGSCRQLSVRTCGSGCWPRLLNILRAGCEVELSTIWEHVYTLVDTHVCTHVHTHVHTHVYAQAAKSSYRRYGH